VFCVKARGELGGRYGGRKSILLIGSRGRIVVVVVVAVVDGRYLVDYR
jgi:hypothetical protein